MEGGFCRRLQYIQEEEGGDDDDEPERNHEECYLRDVDDDGLSVPQHPGCMSYEDCESEKSLPSTPRTSRVSFDSFDDGDDDDDDDIDAEVPQQTEDDQRIFLVQGMTTNVDEAPPRFVQEEPKSRAEGVEPCEAVVVPEHHDSSFRLVSKTMFLCRMGIPYGTLDSDGREEVPGKRGDQGECRWRTCRVKLASWTGRLSITTPPLMKNNDRHATEDSMRQGNSFNSLIGLRKKRPLPGSFASAIGSQTVR
jgi:hypothetical protein